MVSTPCISASGNRGGHVQTSLGTNIARLLSRASCITSENMWMIMGYQFSFIQVLQDLYNCLTKICINMSATSPTLSRRLHALRTPGRTGSAPGHAGGEAEPLRRVVHGLQYLVRDPFPQISPWDWYLCLLCGAFGYPWDWHLEGVCSSENARGF